MSRWVFVVAGLSAALYAGGVFAISERTVVAVRTTATSPDGADCAGGAVFSGLLR